jgi:hypothetical protein
MGNEKCDKAEEVRELKKSVYAGRIESREFTLPSGQKFDFETVLNVQFKDVVDDHDDFYAFNRFVTKSDEELLTLWLDGDLYYPNGSNVPECVIDIPHCR